MQNIHLNIGLSTRVRRFITAKTKNILKQLRIQVILHRTVKNNLLFKTESQNLKWPKNNYCLFQIFTRDLSLT